MIYETTAAGLGLLCSSSSHPSKNTHVHAHVHPYLSTQTPKGVSQSRIPLEIPYGSHITLVQLTPGESNAEGHRKVASGTLRLRKHTHTKGQVIISKFRLILLEVSMHNPTINGNHHVP